MSGLLQVRDYRNCTSEPGVNGPSAYGSPVANKVRLRMSLENVVKDIPLISDDAWTYGDLMVSVNYSSDPWKGGYIAPLMVIHF